MAAIPRAFVASAAQLTSFHFAKQWLKDYQYLENRRLLTSFLASMIGGVSISVMVTPFDLILTRLYNQRKLPNYLLMPPDLLKISLLFLAIDAKGLGIHYTSYMDCISKIYRTEGISAFYKGVGPIYFRLGPHTVLCLVFWDTYKSFYEKYRNPA